MSANKQSSTRGWGNWSVIRRAQVLGAAAGAAITLIACVVSSKFTGNGDAAWFLLGLNLLLFAPVAFIARTLGWRLALDPPMATSQQVLLVLFAALVNAITFSLVARFIAALLCRRRERILNKRKRPENRRVL